MSGIEIALGTIPLAMQAIQVAISLKHRCKSFRWTTKEVSGIENRLKGIRDDLLVLQRQYESLRIDIPAENASIINSDLRKIEDILHDIIKRFNHISKRRKSSFLRNLKAFVKNEEALSHKDMVMQLDRAFERLCGMNQFLVNLNTNQRMSETQVEVRDKLESLKFANNGSPVREDGYESSFYVPANPQIAKQCLDYTLVDENQEPVTFEGKLKAYLLRRVKERHENHSELPIVGALGMRGVGKTCALRGLVTEKDIRDQFCDGILFLAFSPSSSEQDVRDALFSIVSQTGGHNLSREMKKITGENAIDDIIGKASNWFKNRKCLFLVDDIWDTPSTGSALLQKLSTIVENCDITSGLVYSTTNEIDPFDATVRFGLLSPDSNACSSILLKAAGFSREHVIEAGQEDALDSILYHCQGLKIGLAIAGRSVRFLAKRYGEHKAEAWQSHASALMDSPKKLLTEDYYGYSSLHSQFSVSLQTLSTLGDRYIGFQMPYTIEEAFQALCFAQKGDVLRDSTLCHLWNLESIHQARELSKLFADINFIEITCNRFQGKYCEEIRVHGLVLDYANCLADQNYIDRKWIKGWEVWALRLLQSYFGAEKSIVSSPLAFTEWWNEIAVERNYVEDSHILTIVMKVLFSSRIENNRSLSTHGSGVDRMYMLTHLSSSPIDLIHFFTVRKSTFVNMHDFVGILAQERGVEISELTCRLFIFSCLVTSKIGDLFASAHDAATAISSCMAHNKMLKKYEIGSPSESPDSDASVEAILSEFALPDVNQFIAHLVKVNWTLYNNCIEGLDLVDDDRFHILGLPLGSVFLNEAGIDYYQCVQLAPCRSDDKIIPIAPENRLAFEWASSFKRYLLDEYLVAFPEDEENAGSVVVFYVHDLEPDLGNTDHIATTLDQDYVWKMFENRAAMVREFFTPSKLLEMIVASIQTKL